VTRNIPALVEQGGFRVDTMQLATSLRFPSRTPTAPRDRET
jgi:hypothetical protein